MRDERQIRTENKKGLLGYRAKYKGKTVIAVMKGKEFYPPLTEVNTAKTKEEAIEVAKQSEEKTTTYSRSLK